MIAFLLFEMEKEATSKPLLVISFAERAIRDAIYLVEGLYPISNVLYMGPLFKLATNMPVNHGVMLRLDAGCIGFACDG